MKRHTYSLLMACIRLAKGILSACESWVRQEWEATHETDADHQPDSKV